ncbi:hypothetical protein ALI144C_49595 [Actinosynnema sp. ALI-1.44]|uniref:HEXXH motif domain-containing protein n=1 Tax=Actinosynnema sp. ALI-1.44 TaxID=1933779 RepID=UPI00097BCEEC|nr:HEXXH motif domain-containing protein [Actinosynnema sp. ALI-1.44]ONI70677.1 hypothetical protein ALI144C_49595 [Actinosynnema sp. ALI-1.44]
MRVLRESVHSQRKAMLLAIMRKLPDSGMSVDDLVDVENSWRVLSTAEKDRPDVVDDVLMHPSTGVWLVRILRALLGLTGDATGEHGELLYLHAIAAAVATRAGVSCTVPLPVSRGIVCLPTIGVVQSPTGNATGYAELRVSAGSTVLRFDGEFVDLAGAEFSPVQRHHAAAGGIDLVVEVDDTNPYRKFSSPIAPHRMSTSEWERWRALLDDAWDLLVRRHPGYARELSAGLRSIAPIFDDRTMVGSSSSAAFGAVALSSTVSPTALAEILVHELQHSKLNALMELVTLCDDDAGQRWYAPWRDDPRPLAGLLHGLYAFISVVEFWRLQRDPDGDAARVREADYVFAYRRHQLRQAVRVVQSASELTELGSHLVTAVSERVAACADVSVPAEVAETVELMAEDHRITWRLRHVRSDGDHLDRLVSAWLREQSAPPAPFTTRDDVVPFHRAATASAQQSLLKTRIVRPDRFGELSSTAPAGDRAFATGDLPGAARSYVDRVRTAPTDLGAWAGLAVSLPSHTPEAGALRTAPEVVFDLHNRLLGTDRAPVDPVRLAAWLGA